MSERLRILLRVAGGLAVVGGVLLAAPDAAHAEGIIDQPGNHPDYTVELDPHLVLLWDYAPAFYDDEGIGLGLRVTIPFLDGPIETINNSMGISFGLDWAHIGENDCWGNWRWYGNWQGNPYNGEDFDCQANVFVIPVALQWNFWLTDIISVFGEPGMAITHERWNYPCYNNPAAAWGECDESDTNIRPFVIWAGARFLFSERAGLAVRLGWPDVTVGGSFLF